MDTSNTGSGDHPDEPEVPAAEGDLDVSALDALLADVGSRRRRRPTPRSRTPDLDEALLAPATADLPPPPASAASADRSPESGVDRSPGTSPESSAARSTGVTGASTATPVRRRRSSSTAKPPLWRTLWPGGAAPNSERALPPPPTRRAAQVERRFVWAMAVLTGIASVGSSVHPTGVALPDVLLRFGFAVVVTLAAGRARRSTWVVLAGAAAVLNPGGIWMASALVALAIALIATVVDRRRYLGAVVALFAVPALLRADPFGFTGLSALFVWAAVLPVLVSGYRVASRRSRERMQQAAMVVFLVALGGSLLFALAVFLSWGDLQAGSARAQGGLESLRGGQGPEAAVQLSDAADALGSAHDTLSAWWVAPARLVPLVAQQAEAMTVLTGQGKAIASTGSLAASKADYRRLRYEGGQIDIARLRALQQPLADTAESLDAAADRFRDVSSPWLVGPVAYQLARVSDEVDRIVPQADLASAGAAVAPGLLGGDGTRHYFVAFTTEAESRGLDGFMGNWAELTAQDGKLTLSKSGRVAELNDAPGGDQRVVTEPDDYATNYERFKPGTHLQDVTVSPDLPSVAQVIGQLYPQMGGEPIDGVIVVDPYGLAALLNFTGPIQVDGSPETLTADNAADVLVRRQYVEFGTRAGRADFLDQASRKTFEQLTGGDIPGPERIGSILGPAVQDKHLMFSATRPDEQAFLQQLGASGAFPAAQPDRDFFAVTSQNSANNKIDVFLHRTISYDSTYDPGSGRITAKATVTLRNDAPASGLPDSVIGSNDRGLPLGTNRLLLSFYSPLDLVESQVDGAHEGFENQRELGYRVYRRYIGIPPGGTVTVQLDLAGTIDAGADYQLAVGVQPMVNPDSIEAIVHPTDGWLAEDASVLQTDVDRRRVSFLIQPGHDISASTTFRPR
ncbi:MAG: DUF4012 domain-containing protein [Acidimicrobiales bacterium]